MDPDLKQDAIGSATLLMVHPGSRMYVVCNSYHDDIPGNSPKFNAAELHRKVYVHLISHMFGIDFPICPHI